MTTAKIPIIPLGEDYLISFQGDIQDDQLSSLKNRLFNRLSNTNVSSVILDASGLSMMDSFMARVLNELAQGSELNGVETFLVGIQPDVAMSLVQMGLSIPGVRAEHSVGRVLKKLNGD